MIASCRICGKLIEMTTEEAYTPLWCCSDADRKCYECYLKGIEQSRQMTWLQNWAWIAGAV